LAGRCEFFLSGLLKTSGRKATASEFREWTDDPIGVVLPR
jgi:hypothetical protein